MSDSWRITINEIDRSQTLIPNVGVRGAMVINAVRGPKVPVLISTADLKRATDIFGMYKLGNEDIYEACQFLQAAPLWVCTTYGATDTACGVSVNDDGTEALAAGVTGANLDDEEYAPTFTGTSELFRIVAKAPSAENFFKVKVSYSSVTRLFTIVIQIERNGTFEVYNTYKVGLTEGITGDFGVDAYILNVFQDDDLFKVYLNEAGVQAATFNDADYVTASGAAKTSDHATNLAAAWAQFQNGRQYKAAIFMDPSADATLPAIFNTLRNTYQKYASYILPLPRGENVADVSDAGTGTKVAYGINNRGLAFYWNQAYVEADNKARFWTSCVGRIGYKYAKMANAFNGLSPSWLDENEHGGQLGPGILKFEFDPSEDELRTLDANGINALVRHPVYGPLITSDKTAKTPGIVSDDTYIGHSRLFDYIIENVKDQILTYQITKSNDDQHRRLAVMKGKLLLDPVKNFGNGAVLDSYKQKCDTDNNDGGARARRQFVYSLAVRVTPNSQEIVFNFIKVGQELTVNDVLA